MATMLRCKGCGVQVKKKDVVMGIAKEIDDKLCLCQDCWRKEKNEERAQAVEAEKNHQALRENVKAQSGSGTIYHKIRFMPYLLALLCFLMPFITFSCQNEKLISLTGLQLAIGQKINNPDLEKMQKEMDEEFKKDTEKFMNDITNDLQKQIHGSALNLNSKTGKIKTPVQTPSQTTTEDKATEKPKYSDFLSFKKKYEKIGPDIFIILALCSIAACLVISLIGEKSNVLILVLTIAASAFLITFKIIADNDVAKEGMMMLNINYNIGYISTLALMIIAVGYNLFIMKMVNRT